MLKLKLSIQKLFALRNITLQDFIRNKIKSSTTQKLVSIVCLSLCSNLSHQRPSRAQGVARNGRSRPKGDAE